VRQGWEENIPHTAWHILRYIGTRLRRGGHDDSVGRERLSSEKLSGRVSVPCVEKEISEAFERQEERVCGLGSVSPPGVDAALHAAEGAHAVEKVIRCCVS